MLDADQLGMMKTMLEGIDLSENGQALDAIREVGPHTHTHFKACFLLLLPPGTLTPYSFFVTTPAPRL